MTRHPAPQAALLVLLAALALGCSASPRARAGAGSRIGPSPAVPPTVETRSAASFEVAGSIDGPLPTRLTAVWERAVDEILAATVLPGLSVAVAIPGEGQWQTTRGVAAGTRFHAASIGKAITAALVLGLVEEGHVALTDPIAKWFPDFPGADAITVDHLLRHTSGIYSFTDEPELRVSGRRQSADQLIALAASKPPRFRPGERWAYSNTGYVMLARIAELELGVPLAQAIETHVLTPLDLTASAAIVGRADDGLAQGHLEHRPIQGERFYATPHGAGILATTGADLVRLWHALLGGRLVSAAMVRLMLEDMIGMGERRGPGSAFYGRGLMLYDMPDGPGVMIGHGGHITGFTAVVAYIPADRAFVAVLLNDEASPEAVLWSLVRVLRAFRAGKF